MKDRKIKEIKEDKIKDREASKQNIERKIKDREEDQIKDREASK